MRTGAMWARMERVAFTAWLAASAGACTSWQTVDVAPEQLIAEKHPTEMRVTRKDLSRVELQNPRTAGDTLFGTVQPATVTVRNQSQYGPSSITTPTVPMDSVTQARIPFNDAVRIETRHVSAGKTAGLVAGLLVVGAAVAGSMAMECIGPC